MRILVTLYDLVVNTGTLGLDTSVRLVLEALHVDSFALS